MEFKLETYEGAEEGCAIWFHGLERQLEKLNVNEEDFLAHAINATGGKARLTITMLDDRHKSNYQEIKSRMVKLFDLKTREDLLSDFRSFKQSSNVPAREFFVRFQLKVNELLAKGIWNGDDIARQRC